MTGLYLPGAAWRPISYRGQSGLFPAGRPVGEIIHVQVGNGSCWGTFEFAPAGNRRFSNGWVAKNGYGEQYAELNRIPWAQAGGNPYYYAFETEGFPNEALTTAQIETLAKWHNFVGMPDKVINIPGAAGSGTHSMGGAAYGGHSCPESLRAGQRQAVINRALVLRGHPIPPQPPYVPPSGKIILVVDGVFGPQSRMRLQQWAGAVMDGVLGYNSWIAIQRKFGKLIVDGAPGTLTWKRIQTVTGAGVDGIPGSDTYRHLQVYLNAH